MGVMCAIDSVLLCFILFALFSVLLCILIILEAHFSFRTYLASSGLVTHKSVLRGGLVLLILVLVGVQFFMILLFESYIGGVVGFDVRVGGASVVLESILAICLIGYLCTLLLTRQVLSLFNLLLVSVLFVFIVIMSLSENIMTFFIGYEGISILFYIFIIIGSTKSLEIKYKTLYYIILGILSSAVMVFGLSLMWLTTGLYTFADLEIFVKSSFYLGTDLGLFQVGLVFVLLSIFFKMGLVPFTFWVIHIYRVLDFNVFLLFFLGTKPIFWFGFFCKFYIIVSLFSDVFEIFRLIAVLSMVVGVFGAFSTNSLREFLGFSGTFNIGLCFAALSCANVEGNFAVASLVLVIYLFLIFCLAIGFSNFRSIKNRGEVVDNMRDIREMVSFSSSNKFIFVLLVCTAFFGLAGIPPFLGFYSKFMVVLCLFVGHSDMFLLVLGLSVLSAYYYVWFCIELILSWFAPVFHKKPLVYQFEANVFFYYLIVFFHFFFIFYWEKILVFFMVLFNSKISVV
jgi:NADH:ubiquinone oxidoreductase subunit 2 (subunit N)